MARRAPNRSTDTTTERRVLAMASRSSITPYMRTVTVSTKEKPFFGPSVSRTNRKTIATSVLLANPHYGGRVYRNRASTTSGHPKSAAVPAPAAVHPCCLPGPYHPQNNQLDNVRGCWSTRQSSPSTAAKKEGGSLVRGTEESDSDCALRLRRLRFVSERSSGSVAQNINDWCASSVSRQHRSAGYHLVERDRNDDACSQRKKA